MSARFDEFLKHPKILENLTVKMGFTTATPIQSATAPIVLAGKNLFAGAKTGSGKTVAFLAPLSERLFNKEIKRILVLAPTRELVIQMDEEAMQILQDQTEVVSVPLYGGVPTDPQILAIKHHKPKIFIGTPGRVIDLIQEGILPLTEIEAVVLDEADRMCDMGFAPQVTQILDMLPNIKQVLLFSATLPDQLNTIMTQFCPSAERIQVDASDESAETIHHEAIFTSRRSKVNDVRKIISAPEATSIIFVRTRNRADEVHREISRQVADVGILHAGYSMGERERTIRDFREGKIRTLIATDVVARGIDVDIVTHVIHFDLPDQLDDYIHRSGRSGRAGRAGHTIAMVEADSHNDMERFKLFQKKITFEIKVAHPGEEFIQSDSRGRGRGGPSRGRGPRSSAGPRSRGPREEGPRTGGGHSRRDSGERSTEPRTSAPGSRSERSHPHPRRHEGDRPAKLHDHHAAKKAPKKAEAPKAKSGLLGKTKKFFKKVFSKS